MNRKAVVRLQEEVGALTQRLADHKVCVCVCVCLRDRERENGGMEPHFHLPSTFKQEKGVREDPRTKVGRCECV
jgi:chemotaxis receptor (MCP) glutamine deamidase CheD